MSLAVVKAPVIDWWALSPIIALTVGAILVLGGGLFGSERLRSWLVPVLAFDSLLVAAVLLAMRWNDPATIVSGALEVDNLAVALGLICLLGGLVAVVLSMRMEHRGEHRPRRVPRPARLHGARHDRPDRRRTTSSRCSPAWSSCRSRSTCCALPSCGASARSSRA